MHELVRTVDEDGTKHGVFGATVLTVMPDKSDTEVFTRNGIKMHKDGVVEKTRWMVAKLGDVYLYAFGDGRLVLTTQDLYP